MREVGVDLGEEFPNATDEVVRAADVVTMGCGDACPIYPGKRYDDWQLDDPAARTSASAASRRARAQKLVGELL